MPEQDKIYKRHAREYERLIGREDHEGNVMRFVREQVALEGLKVADIGTGTGRFVRLLAPHTGEIVAIDISPHMLREAQKGLRASGCGGWLLSAGDHRRLPLPADVFDLAIAGWSYGHATVWYQDRWREEIEQSLLELKRVLRPGGMAMIFETMGTGSEAPGPPTEILAAYYRYLEKRHGFTAAVIRTDYRFASLKEAQELVTFFFGDALGEKVRRNDWVTLPEWTGVWRWVK